jgi:cytochrome P450
MAGPCTVEIGGDVMPNGLAPSASELPPERLREFDINGAWLAQDYYKALAALQNEAPDIFYTRANGGHWVVTRQALLAQVLQDGERFSSVQTQVPLLPVPQIQIPLHLDPPVNMPYRRMLMHYFSRSAVQSMEPRVRERARELVRNVAKLGGCEFINSLAMPLPVSIFMELAGFDVANMAHFRDLAVRYLLELADVEKTVRNIEAIKEQVGKVIALKRVGPAADLVSDLLAQSIDGRPLTEEEIHSICFLLFIAGLDTVVNASTFVFMQLARSAEMQELLRTHTGKIPDYVEECFRMFGVVSTVRTAKVDVELDGVRVRAGEPLLCILPLAGLDERKNPHPLDFQLDRKERSHMLFGTGVHLCLGHLLARLEVRVLIEEWLALVPRFQLAAGFKPVYQPAQIVSLAALNLRWN